MGDGVASVLSTSKRCRYAVWTVWGARYVWVEVLLAKLLQAREGGGNIEVRATQAAKRSDSVTPGGRTSRPLRLSIAARQTVMNFKDRRRGGHSVRLWER
jgi:hypothetical protein